MMSVHTEQRRKRKIAFAGVYVIVMFLTGANYLNHHDPEGNDHQRFIGAVYSGAAWPVYWLARFSLWLTK